jgi:NAD(P)-dependent dehydrogenase (short-subunit alcohol dehydrogenase family)
MLRIDYLARLIIVAVLVIGLPASAYAEQETKIKSVLVTGASTGIGRHLSETLASSGYHVYAGARKDKDLAELNAITNITAVRLDVTKQDEIDAAVAFIEGKGTGLYALVNNAGIGNGGVIAETPIEDHNMVYHINVGGVYRVTKAFLPLIVASKGRIATTGSIAGTIARAGSSAYSGSKHWIEALTDSLALEMAPLGVKVSVIEPGNYQTNIRRSGTLRALAKVKAAGGEITSDLKNSLINTTAYELSFKKPDEVSAAFMHALFNEKPLRRYVVAPNQQAQLLTISTKINQLVELNQWGPYGYSRDEIVEMLDKAIAQ